MADFISLEIYLGFHLNEVKISSAKVDFITVDDFISISLLPLYFSLNICYNIGKYVN